MKRAAALYLALLLAIPALIGTSGAAEQLLQVSTPEFKLRANESVHAFSCHVRGGTIVSVSRIPKMWSFDITNGEAERSDLTAEALVGAAEFRSPDYFKNFLVVQRPSPPGKWDIPFDISVSVVVFTNLEANPEKPPQRRIGFSRSELLLSPVTDRGQSDNSLNGSGK